MARNWSCGFELNSLTAETSSGDGAIVTNIIHSGTYSMRFNLSAAEGSHGHENRAFGDPETNPIFIRTYIYIASLPDVTISILRGKTMDGDGLLEIRMTSTGQLILWDTLNGAQKGSNSFALNTGMWYRIEMKLDPTNLVAAVVEGKINGVSFASGVTNITGFSGIGELNWGAATITTNPTVDLYFDDLAVNDSTGSFQNSWPGEGSIVHLRPNAAGDTDAWDALTTFEDIDEVTPDDVTTIISSLTSGETHEVNIDDTPAALTSNHLISLLQVGVRFAESIDTDPDPTFVLRIKASTGGTVEEGSTISATSTSYGTNSPASVAPANYTLTLYNLPGSDTVPYTKTQLDTTQIGVRLTNSPVGLAQVSTMWLLVEYVTRPTNLPHNMYRRIQVGNGMSRSEEAS